MGVATDCAGWARPPPARRFPLLDLARIVAALMVVFYHWCFMFNVRDAVVDPKPWRELMPAAQYGYLGVNLFFMISGFLIVQSTYEKAWPAFVRARVVRLWPAYLACCVLTFLVTVRAGNAISTPDFPYNLTMLNGLIHLSLARTPVFVDGVYWTLAVEWAFYALVTRAIAARQLDRIERLLWIWTVVCIIDTIHPTRILDVLLIGSWGGYFIAGAAFFRASAKGWNFSRTGLVVLPFLDCTFQAVHLAAEDRPPCIAPRSIPSSSSASSLLYFLRTDRGLPGDDGAIGPALVKDGRRIELSHLPASPPDWRNRDLPLLVRRYALCMPGCGTDRVNAPGGRGIFRGGEADLGDSTQAPRERRSRASPSQLTRLQSLET